MDLGTSLTWCIGILTFGGLVLAFLRFFRKNGNPKNSVIPGGKVVIQLEEWIRKSYVTKDSCEGNVKRIEQVFEVSCDALSEKIVLLGKSINTRLEDIKLLVKKE